MNFKIFIPNIFIRNGIEEALIPRYGGRFWIAEDGSYIVDYGQYGKFIRPKHIDNSAYLHVNLADSRYPRGNRTYRVHELVAEAFYGERPKGYVIDHIDREKLNNHYKNLRYVTWSTNSKNSVYRGRIATTVSKDGETWNFQTLEETVHFFLKKNPEKSLRHFKGKINSRCKEFFDYKVTYADEMPVSYPRQEQIAQLSLFEELFS